MKFSSELKRRRLKRNLSLREASEAMGKLSYSALFRFESGIGLMKMQSEKANAIAEFYSWPIKMMISSMKQEAKRKKACAK